MNDALPPPDPGAIAGYVEAAAPLLGLALDAGRLAAVTAAFVVVCRIAAPALAAGTGVRAEPAAVFRPDPVS